ncbi:glutamine-hydrolyzing GMP synthase [Helicobacter sp. 23-1046]
MLHPQIIVLDFGSQYTQLIARRLREMGIYTEIMPYFESAESIKTKNPRGLILSGGPASVYEKDAYKPDSEIFTLGIPILGICYGMQFIAHFFGGQVAKSSAQEFGKANLTIIDSRGIFSGVKQDCIVWMSHSDKVIALPSGFSAIGKSENSEICAIADLKREIYAIQFHPEVVHSECGAQILSNFAREICGASNEWNMHNFAEIEIAKVRKIVGFGNAIDCHAKSNDFARNDNKNSNNAACHTERSEVSQKSSDRDISAFSKPQYDNATATQNSDITFIAINASNKDVVCALQVSERDKNFIESNADSIKDATQDKAWQTNAIYYRDTLIGFVMFGDIESEQRLWIDRFMIDMRFSNQGLGTQALATLLEKLWEGGKREEIYISVYEENLKAIRFYERFGFVRNGEKDINNESVMCLNKKVWEERKSDFLKKLRFACFAHNDNATNQQRQNPKNNTACHTERSEVSQKSSDRDISAFSKPQYDKKTQSKFNKQGRSICDEKSGLRSCEQRDKAKTPIEEASDKLRDLSHKGKSAKVLCAVSGGVDSSVVAALLHKAIGENLIPVFVDTGLLRAGEREAVEQMFKQNLQIPLITADASELFLSRLQGITEPEQKRKIIGESFIEVFEREARAHNANGEIKFLAQGTLYPDVIESVSVKGPSKTIKSHHNVGGLPEWMRFELIEPLRELFKDEVRSLGRELGIPESMLMRHPFPGPGLAIRIMGEVTRESLAILREADSIFIEELHKNGLYGSVWQAFCVLLNVRSVGVMGDNRTYDNTIALRAVEAIDGMTARFSHLSFEFLEKVSNRIINEVEGINRVVYDISSKPPATIEWE